MNVAGISQVYFEEEEKKVIWGRNSESFKNKKLLEEKGKTEEMRDLKVKGEQDSSEAEVTWDWEEWNLWQWWDP